MSDGPHRTLPMRPHWKVFAQRAANPVHVTDEVRETMEHALKKDILAAPIDAIRDILENSLDIPGLRIDQLEALRMRISGSAAANTLIDCAIETAINGTTGETATTASLSAAIEELARAATRQIDEHYQRNAGARTSRIMRTRLDEVSGMMSSGGIARELLTSSRTPTSRSIAPPSRQGLDVGPPL
jgi:hypothetical protein